MAEQSEGIAYDPQELPSEVDVQTLYEVQSLRDGIAGINEGMRLLAQEDQNAGTATTSEVTLSPSQFDYVQRSLQLGNSLSLVSMLVLGICCGLIAWTCFTHSWGSHG